MNSPTQAPDTTTQGILLSTLGLIRRDGWRHNTWGRLVPPWCIRRAINHVVDRAHEFPHERDTANQAARQAISATLGQPLGLIGFWEGQPGRTQADVEDMLEKAIAGAAA